MIMDIATEEIGHVEMLATMVARLLEDAPVEKQQTALEKDPVVGAMIAGMNPQHAIVAGLALVLPIVLKILGVALISLLVVIYWPTSALT